MSVYMHAENPLWTHFKNISWSFFGIMVFLCLFGILMLYSAGNGSWDPWANVQALHFVIGMALFFLVYFISQKFWFRYAYVFYCLALILLIAVEVKGYIGMGAQRWIKIGFLNIQPSELMKVASILALARYYHSLTIFQAQSIYSLLVPSLLILIPIALILRQPDLGTTLIMLFTAGAMIFLSGVDRRLFWGILLIGLVAIPVAWNSLRPYQKERVMTFLDPERDPLGAGYHIIQSKIALGSGGILGKGFMEGSQAHLNFLPEKQTDFMFTMICEEFGFLGGVSIIALYLILIMIGIRMSLSASTHFGRFVIFGVIASLFGYVFVNMAMVMGLLPVVGKPLPLLSYGGTSMLTTLLSFGLLMGAYTYEEDEVD